MQQSCTYGSVRGALGQPASLPRQKRFGMFRVPQHERKMFNDVNSCPFVLSLVEGLPESLSAAC
jgi:hypothetical protein